MAKPTSPEDEEEEAEEGEENEDDDADASKHEDSVEYRDEKASAKSGQGGDSSEERDRAAALIQELTAARDCSSKCSPLRQMAFLKVPFVDEGIIEEMMNADSSEAVEKRTASE